MRLDDRRRDGVLFGISLSRRLRPVQTAAPQPWGGRIEGGVRRLGDNIIIFVNDLLPRRSRGHTSATPDLSGRGR